MVFVEYFTFFSLALKYVNYLGVGVCGPSLSINSHMFSCEFQLSFFLFKLSWVFSDFGVG